MTSPEKFILRVHFDGQRTYKTLAIGPSTTAADLRLRVAKKLLLNEAQVKHFVVVLLTKRRPALASRVRNRESAGSSTHLASGDSSRPDGEEGVDVGAAKQGVMGLPVSPHSLESQLRQHWDGARVLEDGEILHDLIETDRLLRGSPSVARSTDDGKGKEKEKGRRLIRRQSSFGEFSNEGYLMFMFKDRRTPLDLGTTFCGSSGEEEEELEWFQVGNKQSGNGNNDNEECVNDGTDDPALASVSSFELDASAGFLSHGRSPSERLTLGMPLEPENRIARRICALPTEPVSSNITEWSLEDLSISIDDDTGTSRNSSDNLKAQAPNVNGGYLFRRSRSNPAIWYRRWCIVHEDSLWCCKSRALQRHILRIPLAHAEITVPTEASQHRIMRNCFEVGTARRAFAFRARDAYERNRWLKMLTHHVQVSNENESIKLAEIIVGDQEYRTSCAEENRLMRVSSSLTQLLEDEGARQIFAQCLREWQCEEGLYFYCDVDDWSSAVAQVALEWSSRHGSNDERESMERASAGTSTRESSMRPTSSRYEAMQGTLWDGRENRRANQSFITRAAELWERAQEIYDTFLEPGKAEHEVSSQLAARNSIKAALDAYRRNNQANVSENENAPSADRQSSVDGSYSTANQGDAAGGAEEERVQSVMEKLPPAQLFCSLQAHVLEDLRRGAFQRFIGTPEGLRKLALLPLQRPSKQFDARMM